MEETFILAGAGKLNVFDNQSVLFTPPPIAFSTDLKNTRKLIDNGDSDGSFIKKEDSFYETRSDSIDGTVSGVRVKCAVLTEGVCNKSNNRKEQEREVLNFSQTESEESFHLKVCSKGLNKSSEKLFSPSVLSSSKYPKYEEYNESLPNKDDTLVQQSNSRAVLSSNVERTVLITDEAEPFCSMSSDSLLFDNSRAAIQQSLRAANTTNQKPVENPAAIASDIETDLEYWTPFTNSDGIFDSRSGPNQYEEFVSSSNAAAQLAQDELDFKAENGIFAGDQMIPLVDNNETGFFTDSDYEQEPLVLDLSGGEQMRAYSSFLGSFNLLDADRKRPTFGSECIKSPLTRHPQPLIDSAEDTTLSDSTLLENQAEPCTQNDALATADNKSSNCVAVAVLTEMKATSIIQSPSPKDSFELIDKDADGNSFAADNQHSTSVVTTVTKKSVSFNLAKEFLAEEVDDANYKTVNKPNESVNLLISRNEAIVIPSDSNQHLSEACETSLDQSMVFTEINVFSPKELSFETCCIGCMSNIMIPLLNESRQWLNVLVEVVSVFVNDTELHLQSEPNPFFLQSKMVLEPQTTEGCRICFQPSAYGKYKAVLSVSGIPMTDGRTVATKTLHSVIVLHAVAEMPTIRVLSEHMPANDVVEFGEFQRGGKIRATVTLANDGLASVPLLLRVHSNSGAGYFRVCAVNGEPVALDTKVQHALAGCGEKAGNNKVTITLDCFSDAITSARSNSVDHIVGMLDMHVDTNIQRVLLKQVTLMAAAGIARIHLPLELHNVIQLDCILGNKSTFWLPVKNAGTVSTVINFAVTDYADLFSVQPAKLLVKPGSTEQVEIIFASSVQTKVNIIESTLMINVQLSETVYEVQLRANVTIPVAAKRHLSNVLLLADKQFMFWGGVDIGTSLHQMICFQNGVDFPFDVSFSLTGSPDFCLLGLEHIKQDNGKQPKVSIAPKCVYRLYISFAPLSVSEANAALHVSVLNSTVSYTIPLLGFGGNSRVAIQNIHIGHSNNYWLNVGPLVAEMPIVERVSLKNTGHRTAFVKAECYRDIACSESLRSGQVSVQPNAFCLAPGKEKTVLVVFKPTQNDMSLCKSESSIVGVIAFYSGNEVLRRRLRKFLYEKQASGKVCDLILPSSVNFDVAFAEETCVESTRAPLLGNEERAFRSNLTRLSLAIVGEPAQKYVSVIKADVNHTLHRRYEEVSSLALQLRRDLGNGSNVSRQTASSSSMPSVSDVPEQDIPSGLQQKPYKSSSSGSSSKENLPLIVAQPQELVFDTVAVGSKRQLSVVVKNRDNRDHQLVVLGVRLPFYVKFKKFTIRARNYVTFPVDFRPTVPGYADCLMAFESDSRLQARVKISGNAL